MKKGRNNIYLCKCPSKIRFLLYIVIAIQLDSVTLNHKQLPQARFSVFKMNYNPAKASSQAPTPLASQSIPVVCARPCSAVVLSPSHTTATASFTTYDPNTVQFIAPQPFRPSIRGAVSTPSAPGFCHIYCSGIFP